MIEAALQWAADGIPVFPVSGKVPRTEHGLKDATTDERRISAWWTAWPDAGIGGATGEPCGAWVLDLDLGHGGLDSFAQLELTHGRVPETRTVRTGGGGRHLWFLLPDGVAVGNRARIRPGIDVRGTGGYVVLPPSGHPSGGRYKLEIDVPPAFAPDWLLDLVIKRPKPAPNEQPSLTTGGSLERKRVLGMVASACERIRSAPEGTRNDTANRECYSIGGYLDAAGMSIEEVSPLLQAAVVAAEQPVGLARRALEEGRKASRALPPSEPLVGRPAARVAPPKAPEEGGREVPLAPRPGVELGDCDPDPLVLPQLIVRRNAKTEAVTVLPTLPNSMIILDNDRRWRGRIRWNQFADEIEVDGRSITDDQEAEIVLWMTRAYGATPSTSHVHEALNAVAHRHPYHPVREYLEKLVWDGVPRLSFWLEKHGGIDVSDPEELPLIRAYSSKWPISIVARAYQGPEGCKVDTALIFAGPKGLCKSTTFRVWGGPWFGDSMLSIGDKDGYQVISGKLVWELAELESVNRRELGAVKAFMTSQIDTYRPSYGRNKVSRPRQCVFCGTVNSDTEPTFLRENDRRWWIVRSVRRADVAALAAERDQLFAEAVVRYRDGDSWWLDEELERAQYESVSAFVAQDPWQGAIEHWVTGRKDFTISEVLEKALQLKLTECTKGDEMRAGSILGRLGYESRQKRVAGEKRKFWSKRSAS